MGLLRRDPLSEIEQMRHQMERMFDQMLGRTRMPHLESAGFSLPPVEVFETDRDVVINAELPGIDPKDVTVEIAEDSVILSGESKLESEIKEDTYYRSERAFGQFRRVIPLPDRIKDQEAKATFKHGLLTIRAPLAEAKKRAHHKVKIEI